MTFRLWLGGPRAVEGEPLWMCPGKDIPYACCAASKAGFDIPADTYRDADPGVSAWVLSMGERVAGINDTAILPLEVDS